MQIFSDKEIFILFKKSILVILFFFLLIDLTIDQFNFYIQYRNIIILILYSLIVLYMINKSKFHRYNIVEILYLGYIVINAIYSILIGNNIKYVIIDSIIISAPIIVFSYSQITSAFTRIRLNNFILLLTFSFLLLYNIFFSNRWLNGDILFYIPYLLGILSIPYLSFLLIYIFKTRKIRTLWFFITFVFARIKGKINKAIILSFLAILIIALSHNLSQINSLNRSINIIKDVINTSSLSSASFIDASIAHRFYEIEISSRNLDSFVLFFFGKGLGSTMDFSKSRDKSIYYRLRDKKEIANSRIIHTGIVWLFYKFGIIGFFIFCSFYIQIFRKIRLIKNDEIKSFSMLIFLLYTFSWQPTFGAYFFGLYNLIFLGRALYFDKFSSIYFGNVENKLRPAHIAYAKS